MSARDRLRRAALAALLTGAIVTAGAGEPARPATRIVSLAPHLTELAFAAGAGDQLVAAVEYSDYPPAARRIPRVGDAFRVDFERLIALRPDAVLAWDSGTPTQTIERMRALNLRVLVLATHRLADIGKVVRTLGDVAGTSAIAEPAAAAFEREIETVRREYRGRREVTVFLQIGDRPLYTVSAGHVMSEIVSLCGGRNIFAQLSVIAPSVSTEAVLAANPQVIIATDDTVHDAKAEWSKWVAIDAVRTGNVYTLPSDDIARATTRLAVGTATICRTLDTARRSLER
jgi:iron complex transport system substrate-binding protein